MSATTHHNLTDTQPARPSPVAARTWRWTSIIRAIGVWHSRFRERQALAMLDSRELRELGVSQWEVEQELAKPFWRE
jgi:uncharacterized protein YjiS (DUF1127 family)